MAWANTRKGQMGQESYYAWGGSNAHAQREAEKNVKAGKKVVKLILVAVAFIGIMHFTTGCTDERSPFCYVVPEGSSTFVCGK